MCEGLTNWQEAVLRRLEYEAKTQISPDSKEAGKREQE